MSARLIKSGHQTGADSFVRFAMPSDGREATTAYAVRLATPHPVTAGQAESEADQIISRARAMAVAIETEARENSSRLVAAEVAKEITRTVDPWHQQLSDTLAEVGRLREVIATSAERELVRLAIEIAKKVVHREVTIDNEIVMTLARIGISRMQNRVAATIHLHPDDFAYVTAHRATLDAGHALELMEDRSIGRGGCLVQTAMGDVDTRIEQQFAELERAFLG
jgi:flagellar biosynthesis/type III secretory pathway protein FliH